MQQIGKLSDSFWNTEYKKKNRAWINKIPGVMPWFGIALKYKCASRILDIGCGCGRNAFYLAKMGFSVTGVDLNDIGLRKAGEHSRQHNLPNVDFVRGNASDVPFKHDLFDGIICLFTLHLLAPSERKKVILEMQRVLNKKGKLCLAEYVNEDFSGKRLRLLLKDFSILGSWYAVMPLLAKSSPPLQALCIIAEKQNSVIEK